MKKLDLSIENILSIKNQIDFDEKIALEIFSINLLFLKQLVRNWCVDGAEDQKIYRATEQLNFLIEQAEYLLSMASEGGFSNMPMEEKKKIIDGVCLQYQDFLQECIDMYFQEKGSVLVKEKYLFDVANSVINYGSKIAMISEKERAKIINNSIMAALTENQFSKIFIEGVNASKKGNAKRGANTINSQHKDRQDYVYKWLDANYKDGDTHEDLASRLEPLLDGERKYGTILKDISKWKKERGVTRKR